MYTRTYNAAPYTDPFERPQMTTRIIDPGRGPNNPAFFAALQALGINPASYAQAANPVGKVVTNPDGSKSWRGGPMPAPPSGVQTLPTPQPRVPVDAVPTTATPDATTTTPTNPRADFLRQVGQQFAPGHEYSALPSSLLDDAINDILNEQRGSAEQYLDRGKARGIFNDVGYGAGREALENSASIARSDLSRLGSSVIDQYRTNLDAIGDEAYSTARGWDDTMGSFSLDPYINRYNETLGRANTNAAGDLRGLIGGKNYFDFANLSNRAGQAQGALNLRDTDVATALRERRRVNSMNRGIGSQGAF